MLRPKYWEDNSDQRMILHLAGKFLEDPSLVYKVNLYDDGSPEADHVLILRLKEMDEEKTREQEAQRLQKPISAPGIPP